MHMCTHAHIHNHAHAREQACTHTWTVALLSDNVGLILTYGQTGGLPLAAVRVQPPIFHRSRRACMHVRMRVFVHESTWAGNLCMRSHVHVSACVCTFACACMNVCSATQRSSGRRRRFVPSACVHIRTHACPPAVKRPQQCTCAQSARASVQAHAGSYVPCI